MLWEMVKDKTSEIGTKVEYDDNGDLAHNAITSKVKMDADYLTDFGQTELRTKPNTGCPIIMFLQFDTQNQKLVNKQM